MSSSAAAGVSRGWAVHRSLTLLRVFLLASAVILVSPHLPLQIKQQLRRQPDIVSVKVWRPDGVLVWTNRAPQRIGHRFSLDGELGETIADNTTHASISKLDQAENAAEQEAVNHRRVFEVYAPVESKDGTHAIGAYEIYAKPEHTEAFIASRKRLIWFAILAVFLTLYGALALLVRNASSTLRRQASTLD